KVDKVEEVDYEIENPFCEDPNDIELDELCDYIEKELNFINKHGDTRALQDMEYWWNDAIINAAENSKISKKFSKEDLAKIDAIKKSNDEKEKYGNDAI
ncbi:5331_t:CDS:2, partial [Racocetra fulgida]